MNLVEKLRKMEINPCYDMSYDELCEIAQAFSGTIDVAAYGFRFGYLKGCRAQKKADQEQWKDVPDQPKYKTEYRRAINKKVEESKDIIDLKAIYQIIDLLNRERNHEMYETLTDGEWTTIIIIRQILGCGDESKLNRISAFISDLLYPRKSNSHD